MTRRAHIRIEPRLLSSEEAAAYCGMSVTTFRAECPITPIRIRTRVLFDRRGLDAWVDTLGGDDPKSRSRKKWLDRLDDAHASQRA